MIRRLVSPPVLTFRVHSMYPVIPASKIKRAVITYCGRRDNTSVCFVFPFQLAVRLERIEVFVPGTKIYNAINIDCRR